MANLVVRAGSTYINDTKVAEASEAEITFNPKRTGMYGADGWMGLTRGAVNMDVRVTILVPVSGNTPDFVNDLVNQNDVELAMVIGGYIFRGTGGYNSGTMRYVTETGRCEGTFGVEIGKPILVNIANPGV